ncbi:MAG: hypothetical protein ACOY90_10970 [Candidatus Zhuqueibacterota bacterium]
MDLKNDKLLKIGELPKLKILPISDIIFHEEPDTERSARLVEYLRKENRLKNPPVVATHAGTTKHILLDGANRLTALQKLDIPDVLVQEIDLFDPGLIFLQWHHAVEQFSKELFLSNIAKLPEISIAQTSGTSITNEEDGELLCQIQFADASIFAVRAHEDLFQRVRDLQGITDLYHGSQFMDRVSYTNLEHLKNNYPQFSALIVFRKITKEELVQVTDHGMRIPSGITRIILPKRALRLNVPLDLLRFDVSAAQKNHWLNKRINDQIKDKSIRFYHEPTFLFDE